MICEDVVPVPVWQLVAHGNSLTHGSGAVPYTASLAPLISSRVPLIYNCGVDGATTPRLVTGDYLCAASPVLPQGLETCVPRLVVVLWEISNDIITNDPGAEQLLANVRKWVSLYRERGARVVVLNCLPRADCTGEKEASRVECNARLSAEWADFCDAILDVAEMFPDPHDADNYQVDGIHLKTAAYARIAAALAPVVLSLVGD